MSTNTSRLYDTDYGLWLTSQIESIRSQRWDDLDIDNLIEELEGLDQSNKRQLESYLVVIITHLVKWQYQFNSRSGSWKGSICYGRKRIARLFRDQPNLKPYVSEILQEAYTDALELTIVETDLPVDVFPAKCPYSVDQILDVEFLPVSDYEDLIL